MRLRQEHGHGDGHGHNGHSGGHGHSDGHGSDGHGNGHSDEHGHNAKKRKIPGSVGCACVCVCVCVGFCLSLQNSRVIQARERRERERTLGRYPGERERERERERALAYWGYRWPHLLHAVGFGRLGERAIFRSSCKVTGDVIDGTRCFTATEQEVTQRGSQSNLMKSAEAQDLDIHFTYCSLAGAGAPLIPAFVRQPSWGNVLPVPEEDTPNTGETSTCDQPSKTAILYLLVTMSSFN